MVFHSNRKATHIPTHTNQKKQDVHKNKIRPEKEVLKVIPIRSREL